MGTEYNLHYPPVIRKDRRGEGYRCRSLKSCLAYGKECVNSKVGKDHLRPYVSLWHQTAQMKEIIPKSGGFQTSLGSTNGRAAQPHSPLCHTSHVVRGSRAARRHGLGTELQQHTGQVWGCHPGLSEGSGKASIAKRAALLNLPTTSESGRHRMWSWAACVGFGWFIWQWESC